MSHNIHSATYNYKYTFSVEIVPICKARPLDSHESCGCDPGCWSDHNMCFAFSWLMHLVGSRMESADEITCYVQLLSEQP